MLAATKAEVEDHFNTHGTGEITEIKLMNGFGFIEYKDEMDARDVVPGKSSLTPCFPPSHHACTPHILYPICILILNPSSCPEMVDLLLTQPVAFRTLEPKTCPNLTIHPHLLGSSASPVAVCVPMICSRLLTFIAG